VSVGTGMCIIASEACRRRQPSDSGRHHNMIGLETAQEQFDNSPATLDVGLSRQQAKDRPEVAAKALD